MKIEDSSARCWFPALGLAVFLLLPAPRLAVAGEYETPPELPASTVLPPQLVESEHHKVHDGIRAVDALYEFTVEDKRGTFQVYGEALLRIRLRELDALDRLEKTSRLEAGAVAAGDAATESFKNLGKAIAHPVRTTKGLYGGIKRMFRSTKWDAQEVSEDVSDAAKQQKAGGPKEGEKNLTGTAASNTAKRFIDVNYNVRMWAQELGVDPYTTNPLLRKHLNRVATASGVAGLGTSVLMVPLLPGALGIIANASGMVYEKDWREIFVINAKAMRAMGADDELVRRVGDNDVLTPTMMTLIVSLLESMVGVEDRYVVIQQATLLETESEVLFFVESLMTAHWYHGNVAPVQKFLFHTLVPVVMTRGQAVVAFTAADAVYWTEGEAETFREFSGLYYDYSDDRQIWAADWISPMAKRNMEEMGWTVTSSLRSKYMVEIPWGLQEEAPADAKPE